jgi:coat protein Gp5
MANSFNFPNWIAMKGLRRLTNKLLCAQFGNTQYGKEYKKEFAVGDTVRVPLPQKYTIRTGLTYTPQALGRPVTTIALQEPLGIDFEWDDFEAAVFMERQDAVIEEAYINPAMDQIAQEFDSRFATYAVQNTPNIVGVLGTDPTSFQTMNTAREILVQLAGWNGAKRRGMLIAPQVNTSLVNAAITYFNPSKNISDQYKDGVIGEAMGFTWYESMSLPSHTAGTYASTAAFSMNGANQQGSSILINCTAGDVFNDGDVLAIGTVGSTGVYAVNPMTRNRTTSARLRPFVVTQTTVATGATVTLPIYPSIFGPGSQFQNVDALNLANATVTFFPGTSSPSAKSGINGLAITSDAFALVGVPLEEPKNQQVSKTMRDPDTGIAVRFVRAWDPIQSKMINRWDACMGLGTLYADSGAVRILGA